MPLKLVDLVRQYNMQLIAPDTWNQIIASLPGAHLLQTWEWGNIKARYGWQPIPLIWSEDTNQFPAIVGFSSSPLTPGYAQINGGYQPSINQNWISESDDLKSIAAVALVLQRALPIAGLTTRFRVLYVPKGPLLKWDEPSLRQRILDDLQTFAHRQGAIFIKIDPNVWLGTGIPETLEDRPEERGQAVLADLKERGWRFSDEQIQFRNTVLIDLTPSEDELLARMRQKTRYNIRLAERRGVTIRVGTPGDWGLLYRMYAETSVRDGFTIRDENYYRTIWQTFQQPLTDNPQDSSSGCFSRPVCESLIAEVDGEPVAAVVIFRFARKAWYLYGMSREAHREKMPNYILQWEAMRRAKAAGCTIYDLWGAPDDFTESDTMWGVFRFKEGLGGMVVRTIGAWDYPPHPLIYRLYTQALPRLLEIMRRRGNRRTRQALAA
jgi:lipid II:glycine glycyltransferase (peptidoglycan interpeptide bridge formation enzyme)